MARHLLVPAVTVPQLMLSLAKRLTRRASSQFAGPGLTSKTECKLHHSMKAYSSTNCTIIKLSILLVFLTFDLRQRTTRFIRGEKRTEVLSCLIEHYYFTLYTGKFKKEKDLVKLVCNFSSYSIHMNVNTDSSQVICHD